ncbi:MAG: hypothetical protein QM644_18705 [Mobilitalea sp.]
MKDKKQRNELQVIKTTDNKWREIYSNKMTRSIYITGAAATASAVLASGKLIMGIVSLSFFACVNSFYTFGMILAKAIALAGIRKEREGKEQYPYYYWSGVVLIISSIIYMIYSIRLFFHPITSTYHMYVALGISAVTFFEISLNIRGVILTRDKQNLLIHAIKMINLSASLIALVLTQMALLSISENKGDLVERSNANGMIGLCMGTIATLIGCYMIARVRKFEKQGDLSIEG